MPTPPFWHPSLSRTQAFLACARGLFVGLGISSASWAKPVTIDSTHYHLWTTAPGSRSSEALHTAEILHRSWKQWTGALPDSLPHKHQLRLFASRAEMRKALPGLGWAEALYHQGICDQYDDPSAELPWHWLVHEATHQLAWEDSHLPLPRWANEGLACLFSVSRIRKNRLILGSVERETYPTWWLVQKPLSGKMERDLRVGLLVSPSRILSESDDIDIAASLNSHYLSWWSMAHFFHATDSNAWRDWVLHDATKNGLIRRFGPAQTLDQRWYKHVLELRDSVVGR